MPVNDDLPSSNEVVGSLTEQSLGLFHKIFLVEDENGTLAFYRETLNIGADEPTSIMFGPFVNAVEALRGIQLI